MNKNSTFCGLYCGACLCNIAWETNTLKEMSERLNRPEETLSCTNCKTALHQDCSFVVCCSKKNFNDCSECPEMPCVTLTEFANDGISHHASCIINLSRIKEIGLSEFLLEQEKKYTCPQCHARIGWSYTKCLACGIDIKHE